MSKQEQFYLFPVGRYVGGNLAVGRETKDDNNQPIKNKDGSNQMKWSIGLALAKNPGVDWKQEPWGQAMVAKANADFPQGQSAHRDFAWKVTDGDSTEINRANKRPCDNENFRGHWVLWFQQYFPIVTRDKTGQRDIPAENIKPGHYVEIYGSFRGNEGKSPGLYLNPAAVAHAASGVEISLSSGPDLSSVAFGQGSLPQGANAVPASAMQPPEQAPPPPTPTVPHAAPLVPPTPGPRFTLGAPAIAAGANTVEEVLAWPGWNEELLIQHGHIVRA